uniref:Uncharacterized protein n=1 Tax=Quercus lobata TaxID=97700 RepID=A0A7N2LQM0_QUELO
MVVETAAWIAALAVNYCTPDGKPCTRKATKELGYFLAVTALESIGEDYWYVAGEYPVFLNDKLSKIEKDVVIRFIVIGTK